MTKPIVINPNRQDPYKNFRFRVLFNGKVVAAANSITGLGAPASPVSSLTITMLRGASNADFADWAAGFAARDAKTTRRSLPRSLVLRLHDEADTIAATWKLRGCSVSGFQHARSRNDVAIETLTLQVKSIEPS